MRPSRSSTVVPVRGSQRPIGEREAAGPLLGENETRVEIDDLPEKRPLAFELARTLVHDELELLLAGLHLADAHPMDAGKNARGAAETHGVEPHCLMEVRRQMDRVSIADLVPEALVVGRLDAEGVPTGRNVVVVGRTPAARVDPITIVRIELVLEAHGLGRDEAQCRVAQHQVASVRRSLGHVQRPESPPVDGYVFDVHRRRQ